MENQWAYIYGLTDPNSGLIRYVGKSDNPKVRRWNHISDAKNPKKTEYKYNWIRTLLKQNQKPGLIILEEVSQSDWRQAEKDWKKDGDEAGLNLTNLTDGGDGLEGYNHSKETKKKISKASIERGARPPDKTGTKQSPEHIAKRMASRIANGGYTLTEKQRLNVKRAAQKRVKEYPNSFKGKKHTEESKRKMSEAKKGKRTGKKNHFYGKKHSDETRRKISEALKNRKLSKEQKQKISEANQGKETSEETREKLRQANLGKKHSRETKDKLSKIVTQHYIDNPEAKEHLSQKTTEYFTNPENRVKQSIAVKNGIEKKRARGEHVGGLPKTEEQKREHAERMKLKWQDPTYRAKMIESQKRRRERENL